MAEWTSEQIGEQYIKEVRARASSEFDSEIVSNLYFKVDRNTVEIVLSSTLYAYSVDFLYLFDDTSVAWSKVFVDCVYEDGPRIKLKVYLVTNWSDEKAAQWELELTAVSSKRIK